MSLEARIRDVLGRLQMIAEGATIHLDPDKGGGHASESKVPSGVTLRSGGAPKKHQVSLFEWYGWHFADAAGNRPRLEALYLAAEVDYRSWRFRVARRVALKSGDLVENDPLDGGKAEEANAHGDTIRILHRLRPIGVAMAGPDIYDAFKD